MTLLVIDSGIAEGVGDSNGCCRVIEPGTYVPGSNTGMVPRSSQIICNGSAPGNGVVDSNKRLQNRSNERAAYLVVAAAMLKEYRGDVVTLCCTRRVKIMRWELSE